MQINVYTDEKGEAVYVWAGSNADKQYTAQQQEHDTPEDNEE